MSKENTIVLSLHVIGSPQHPRYVVSNKHLWYWTGEGWSVNQGHARIFASTNDGYKEIRDLLMLQYEGEKPRRFTARVTLELLGKEATPEQIREWVYRVSRLVMATGEKDTGPVAGSLGLCYIDWDTLQEEKDEHPV